MIKSTGRINKRDDNSVVFSIKLFIVMLIVFFVAILVATAIPNGLVDQNADESIAILKNEGNTSFSYSSQKNDGFSDNIMYSMAESQSKKTMNIFEAAMDSSYISNANPDQPKLHPYERFWHGYIVLLKPALIFTDIVVIRQLVIVIFMLLVAVAAYMIARNISRYAGVAFVIAIAIFNPPVVMVGLEYFSTFAVMLCGSVALLYALQRNAPWKIIVGVFIVIGGSTIFFDFLTTPIITWGVPLIIYIAYVIKHNQLGIIHLWRNAIILSLAWGAGYLLTWAAKWLVASLVLQRNIVKNAIDTTTYYTSAEGAQSGVASLNYTLSDMFELNIEYAALFKPLLTLSLIFSVIMIIVLIVKRRLNAQILGTVALFAAIAIAPFVWMLLTRSHSYIHHWMTNRDLIITTFSTLALMGYLLMQFEVAKRIFDKTRLSIEPAISKTNKRAKI